MWIRMLVEGMENEKGFDIGVKPFFVPKRRCEKYVRD